MGIDISYKKDKRFVSPSILSADFLNLEHSLSEIERTTDFFHIDVMDGMYVPNISFGMPIMKAVHSRFQVPLDVHLMIQAPDRYLESFANLGAQILTVHQETCPHLHRTLSAIKSLGIKAGVSLNPSTPLVMLEEVLDLVDMVLIMSVNPGFGGQSFIPQSLSKVARLRKMFDERGLKAAIEVDGGCSRHNAQALYEAGANILVAGSAVFGSNNPSEEILTIRNAGL